MAILPLGKKDGDCSGSGAWFIKRTLYTSWLERLCKPSSLVCGTGNCEEMEEPVEPNMLLKYQKINEICAYSAAKHQKPYSLYVLNCIESTCTSCPSSSPVSRSLPRRTYRTILWDMWAKWVSRDVFPSPASKLLYSNKLKLNTSLTSLRYVRTAVL